MTQAPNPPEMLVGIAEAATRTVQDQHAEVQRAAASLGTAVSESSGNDHSLLIRDHRRAKAKLEGMQEILKIINGFRSGLYTGTKEERH